MARKKTRPHVGSDFEDFLREDKRLEAATALALKRVRAYAHYTAACAVKQHFCIPVILTS